MENIHIKLNVDEAINGKRGLLSSEINLINLINSIREYNKLREEEAKKRISLKAKLGKMIIEITNLKKDLPTVRRENIKNEKVERESKIINTKLESELEEIRQKLERLE